MPANEYKCEKCHAIVLNIESSADDYKRKEVECPKCGSQQVRELLIRPSVPTETNPNEDAQANKK